MGDDLGNLSSVVTSCPQAALFFGKTALKQDFQINWKGYGCNVTIGVLSSILTMIS